MKNSKELKPDRCQRSLASSSMAQNQLIDSLTSHISLYSSRTISADPNPSPRSSILRWFSSLSIHQRQAHLTTIDAKFIRIVVQMVGKIRTKGHGCFIILPDILSGDLPSVCYKKSRGLISRMSESNEHNRCIFESIRLFNSREGEKIEDCSCSVNSLDTFTVSEDFLENFDRFVETMDNVSSGAFLRGEGCDLASDWVELDWLKAKGYYSIEAFIANRLEVRLRMAWLNSNVGKRRGVKLKEKLNATAVATSVYWRKRGCLEWWINLDAATKKKVWTTILGKSAKFLVQDILRGANCASEDELWLFGFGEGLVRERYTEKSPLASSFSVDGDFGMTIESTSLFRKPRTFANILKGLRVLHEVNDLIMSYRNNELSVQNVFFSSLVALSTLSDCILRKLRGFLVAVSVDTTKFELLEDVNCKRPPTTLKEKAGKTNRKKKGKAHNAKKSNPVPISARGRDMLDKPIEDSSGLGYNINGDLVESIKMSSTTHAQNNLSVAFPVVKDQVHVQASGKGKATEKKSRKQRNKKVTSLRTSPEKNSSVVCPSCPTLSAKKNSSVVCAPCPAMSTGGEHLEATMSACSSMGQVHMEDVSSPVGEGSNLVCSAGHSNSVRLVDSAVTFHSSQDDGFNHRVEENETVGTLKTSNPVDSLSSEDFNIQDSCHANENEETMLLSNGKCQEKDKPVFIQDKVKEETYDAATVGASDSISYEWPFVAPAYLPVTSHLPTAADRLHLDVGQNLHAYVRQPFVPSVHHARKPSVEGGCKQVLPRPLSMSLDWPPMVRSNCGLTASLACNYDSGVFMDFSEPKNFQDGANECENNWMSEEEYETHAVSGVDYSQYFGGGVMYWNSSDQLGAGFSRPPSLSSEDSSWAWHEAEMKRAVDDMVAFSSSYSTNGLTSPTAASFCSPFDPLGSGNQPLGYVVPGNELTSKVLQASATTVESASEDDISGSLSGDAEVNSGDSLSYPILRPIIIPSMSRERSRSEFKRGYDLKSPNVPHSRRERPYIKRPPSPVVLCVPRAPLPPSPSPISEPRTRRGFSTVRSGSSSPRHWGMRGWLRDAINWEEACGAEVVWPWRNKNLSVRPIIQPLPGALLPDHLIAMSQLARDQEHPDVAFPLQPHELLNCPTRKASLSLMHNLLNEEIDSFCKQVAAENMARKSYISWAVKRVARSLQVLWPRSRTNIFGSYATGLCLPSSDVDLVVSLPPVRNLEPIKEAGILEGRNGIKETCLQHAARYLANQEWVKSDSLKTVENTAIPIIMLVVEIPHEVASTSASNMQSPKEDCGCASIQHSSNDHSDMVGFEDSSLLKCTQTNFESLKNVKSVRLDISFKTPSHTGLKTTELVKDLTEQFPAATPLALVLKQFLSDRCLDQSYSGGLSSYCLVLVITRFLQHQHHLGRPINQNFGSLLMDFLYFFGNVFDPRQMRISVQGSGVYRNRERGHSIDPIHIDDPLCPSNNVGRNCFRIHQCIKAFSEAYSTLQNELAHMPSGNDLCADSSYRLLPKIIPSISIP